MVDPVSFASEKWLKPLYEELFKRTNERAQELARIGDVFGDPKLLATYYIQPYCQHQPPSLAYRATGSWSFPGRRYQAELGNEGKRG